jgi:hypothetical protein
MSLISWLRNRTSSRSPRGRAQHRPAAPRFRPQLESLEDRALPSTFYAATASDLIGDIKAANKGGGANTIVLTAPTTSPYVLTAVDNTTDGATGLPVISKKDSPLTIIGNGDTIERSTAAGTPVFRLVDVASGGSLTLENVTLQNGLAFGWGVSAEGGAVFNQGTLTLTGATVYNNTAQGDNGFDGVVTNSKLKNGQSLDGQAGADAAGGGIWSSGSVTLQGGTTLQGNAALGGQGGAGGRSQTAAGSGSTGGGGFGGGLYEAGGSATITSATVAYNAAFGGTGGTSDLIYIGPSGDGGIGSGGGVYVANGTLNMGDPQGLSSVTVQYNRARGGSGGEDYFGDYSFSSGRGGNGSGGGIAVAAGTVTLTFVEVLSNTATGGFGGAPSDGLGPSGPGGDGFGGGLSVNGGTVTLNNDTATNNQCPALGTPGSGYGPDIYIASGATVYLDAFTVAHTGNTYGTYILLW